MAKRPPTVTERKAEVVRLRLTLGWQFEAITVAVGCTTRWAKYVVERHGGPQPIAAPPVPGPSFTHRWSRRRALPGRFGQPCRIVNPEAWHFGPASQVMVEFPDGVRELGTMGDLRRIEPMPKWRAAAEARGRRGGGKVT